MLQNHLRRERRNRTLFGCAFVAASLITFAICWGLVEWRNEPLLDANRRMIWGLIAAPFVLFALGYGLCLLRFRWRKDLWRELTALGDPPAILEQIDVDLADSRQTFLRGRLPRFVDLDRPNCVVLTKSWLIQFTGRQCLVLPMSDVLAVSCHRYLKYSSNLRRKLSIELHMRVRPDRLVVLATGSVRWMNDLMVELPERCPHALCGLNVDWRQLSAESLWAAVEKRARALAAMNETERGQWIDEQKNNLSQFDDQQVIGTRTEPLRQCMNRELRLRWLIGSLLLLTLGIGSLAWAAVPGHPIDDPEPVRAMLVLLFLPALYYVLRFFRWSLLSRLPRALRANGDENAVLSLIDAELVHPTRCRQWGSLWEWIDALQSQCLIITASWVLFLQPRRCVVVQLDDIVWVYQQYRTRRSILSSNRLIWDVRCQLANGRDVTLRPRNPYWAEEFIDELLQRKPGLLTGHQSRWQELAAAGPEALRQEVDRRAAEFDQLSARRRRDWLVDGQREFRKTAGRLEQETT